MIVVADTSPLNYLILIGHVEAVHDLYDRIAIPTAVLRELSNPHGPEPVRKWASDLPWWVEVREPGLSTVHFNRDLDAGERDAIILALTTPSSALLIDDLAGREEARGFGLRVVGTLGVLKDAHEHRLLDFRGAVEQLRRTNYRIAPSILDAILNSI